MKYAQLPSVIKYDSADVLDSRVSSLTLYSRLITRLEYLQNLFLLERLLIKHLGMSSRELVTVSLEMLSMTAGIWKQRERLLGLHSDFEWLVCHLTIPLRSALLKLTR